MKKGHVKFLLKNKGLPVSLIMCMFCKLYIFSINKIIRLYRRQSMKNTDTLLTLQAVCVMVPSCVVNTVLFIYFIYLGFYVAFNTVQVISRRVVGRTEETSTYSSLGFCTVNCRPTASNYQLSHLRP